MMKMHERSLIEKFLKAGGRVEVVKPSKRRTLSAPSVAQLQAKAALQKKAS